MSVTFVPSRTRRWHPWTTIAFAWLALLAAPVTDLLRRGAPAEIAASLAGVAVFVVVYAWYWLRVRARRVGSGGGVAVIALAAVATTLGLAAPDRWWLLFIYTVVAAGSSGPPPRAAAAAVGGVTLLVVLLSWLVVGDAGFVAGAAVMIALIGAMCLAISQLIAANRELGQAREEIARLAVSEERLRFARDLHDVLGHSLSLIVIKAGLAVRLAQQADGRAPGEMAEVERVALDALRQVREAVTAYRRPTLQEELREGGRLLEAAGIRGLVDCTLESPPAEVEAALAWAVREAVTNVVRHSRASRCCIDARRVPGAARVEVTDNGRGASEASEGNGLSGLRERLANLGGELRVRSGSEGTVLTASVPWADRGVSP